MWAGGVDCDGGGGMTYMYKYEWGLCPARPSCRVAVCLSRDDVVIKVTRHVFVFDVLSSTHSTEPQIWVRASAPSELHWYDLLLP